MASMRCEKVHGIGALVDGELAEDERRDLIGHVRGCPACRSEMETLERMSRDVRSTRLQAPASLRGRIERALAAEEHQHVAGSVGTGSRPRLAGLASIGGPRLRQAAMLAAACLLTVLLTFAAIRPTHSDRLASDAFSAHLRGLLQDNPVQIASSDRHVVKPWFAGRIVFAPVIKDLNAEGFPLAGGRVDVIDQERAAALVYHRRQHAITLFIRPGIADEEPRISRIRGYAVITWSKDGMSYLMVSDLNEAELLRLQALL